MIRVLLFVFAVCVSLRGENIEPPLNPFLAKSPWPMMHRNPYNQASTPIRGPEPGKLLSESFVTSPRISIALLMTGPRKCAATFWGSSPGYRKQNEGEVFTIGLSDEGTPFLARSRAKNNAGKIDSAMSGAYVLLDHQNRYYIPDGNSLSVYQEGTCEVGKAPKAIKSLGQYKIPQEKRTGESEFIVGLNMTYDGKPVFLTNHGLLGIVEPALSSPALSLARVQNQDGSTALVSNSLAVDETGGIYFVTEESLYKYRWDSSQKSLQYSWKVPLPSDDEHRLGMLGKGSRTTPTLVGGPGQEQFVAVTDGRKINRVQLYWRNEIPVDWKPAQEDAQRRLAGEVALDFRLKNLKASTTDQSLVASGNELMAVSNTYGDIEGFLASGIYSSVVHAGAAEVFGEDLNKWTIFYSNYPQVAPKQGMQKIAWDSQKRELRTVWANNQVSCPNGVPTMSRGSHLAYCYGQRKGSWTLEALDWETGEEAFHFTINKQSSQQASYNSFYASTQICGDGLVCSGTFGGAVFIEEASDF